MTITSAQVAASRETLHQQKIELASEILAAKILTSRFAASLGDINPDRISHSNFDHLTNADGQLTILRQQLGNIRRLARAIEKRHQQQQNGVFKP